MFLSGLLTRFRNFITYNIYLKLLYHKFIKKSSVIYTKLMGDRRFYLHDLCAFCALPFVMDITMNITANITAISIARAYGFVSARFHITTIYCSCDIHRKRARGGGGRLKRRASPHIFLRKMTPLDSPTPFGFVSASGVQ